MSTGKKYFAKRYFYIIISILAGIICFAAVKIKVDGYQTDVVVSNISQQLETEDVVLALAPAIYENEMGNIPYVEWWFDEDENKYYLFVPQFLQNGYQTVWVLKNTESIWIGNEEIHNGDTFQVEAGEYTVKLETGNEYPLKIMHSSSVATLFLKTESGNLGYIHESKENIDRAEYALFDENGKLNNFGEIEQFRCRGNASFTDTEKKSYRIDLKEKSYLLDLGEDKDWVLLSNAFDRSLSKNMIINTMAVRMGMDYTPDMDYVDLYIDGEYRGNYLLSENIQIENDRVNIRDLEKETEMLNPGVDLSQSEVVIEDPDKLFSRKWYKIAAEPEDYTGGYLMELELTERYGLEASGFITSRMQAVVVKSPEYASLNQVGYVADIYQDFEDAVFTEGGQNPNTGKYFYEYIDMESFAGKYMIEELAKNLDASYSSFFIYKPEYDEKLYAGPVWDYDKALGINSETEEGVSLNDPETLYAAVQKKDGDILWALYEQPYFRQYISGSPKEQLKVVTEYLVDYYIDENAEWIEASALMNDARWNYVDEGDTGVTRAAYFYENVNEVKDFLDARMMYLDEEWNNYE